MSGSVGLGIQVPDLGRTLAQVEGIKASRLAQIAQQRDQERDAALTAALGEVGPALAGGDPTARTTGLQRILATGDPRGVSLALSMLERDAAPNQTRSRNVGSQVVDEEYDRGTRTWRQIGSAPRWAPQQARTTFTDITDEAGNVIAQRSSAGQYIPVSQGGGNMFGGGEGGLALQYVTRNAERYATGQMPPEQERQYEAALSVLQRPRVSLDPQTGTMTTITPQLPPFVTQAVERRRGGQAAGPPAGAPEANILPPAAMAMPAPGPAPAPAASPQQADAPQQVAPGVTQQQVAPARITPQAREAVRRMEVETRRVTDAMDQYERVLAETGGPGVATLLNDPTNPRAQRILGAYNNLVTALRSEAFLNTGVLQPAEMGMIERMLLAPDSVRGAMATPEAIRARLGEIRTFLDGGVNRVRETAGMPRVEVPQRAAPAGGAPTMRWNPETGQVEPIR